MCAGNLTGFDLGNHVYVRHIHGFIVSHSHDFLLQDAVTRVKPPQHIGAASHACTVIASLRWHYPGQVQRVGDISWVALSARLTELPLGWRYAVVTT